MQLTTDWLDETEQRSVLTSIEAVLQAAPLYVPHMPRTGKPMSVRMSNCGALGWYTDQAKGYRYIAAHPLTGQPWPAIPDVVLALWQRMTNYAAPPEACLINYYDANARMGLHRDADEAATDAPVVSLSLGDTALFRLGGSQRKDRSESFRLVSGTLMVLDGPRRHWYHGIDRVLPGTSTLLSQGGRINLTLRRVTSPTE